MVKPTLPEQIANHLRRDILRGKLPPGAPLKERDSAAEMGVSRTPMREAFRILAKERLIELRPSRSPVVAQPEPQEIADRVAVLLALEQLSAELACRFASQAEIDEVARISRFMADHFDTMDPLDMFEVDMSFHTAVVRASQNKVLAETHGTFLAQLWHARYLAAIQRRNRERVVMQHDRIVAALRARDPAATRAAIDHHLHRLAEDIASAITQKAAAE